MYASLNYIQVRHSYGEIEGQPSQAPQPAEPQAAAATTKEAGNAGAGTQMMNGNTATPAPAAQQNGASDASSPLPDPPETFRNALREMAQELILKEQQIEHLINSLPGLGNSESNQERRMRELEADLREAEAIRERKEAEREEMVNLLGQVIVKVKRVP